MSPSDARRSAELLEWVRRIRAGDVAAFEALFTAYYEPLVRFAFGYVKGREPAEELVQDIFLALWEQRARWDVHEAVNTYLYTMTRNRALNMLRRQSLERRSATRAQGGEPDFTLQPQSQSADERLRLAELDDAVMHAINRLPRRCRETFVLSRFHHLSYDQIARVMRISERTVQEQIARALRALRTSLAAWLE
jgi:RNA polymerase sigma-70 factor, ECF subfamily